jgi:addiction module HigA family antidote
MSITKTRRAVRPIHPGEMLREDFPPDYGLTVSGLAEAVGVSRQTMNELLRERRSVSPEMAPRQGTSTRAPSRLSSRSRRLLLGTCLLLALAAGAPSACHGAPRTEEGPGFEVGREVEIEGLVLENVRDCARGLYCYLRLETERGEVAVVYAAPRGIPCPNAETSRAAGAISEGERVRIFARATGEDELSTCPDERYTVTPVEEPAKGDRP